MAFKVFSKFSKILKSFGFEFFEDYGINWLFDCLSKIDDEERTFEKNAGSLSELLLSGWLKYGTTIKRDPKKMHRFAFMVDKLANYGEPTAIRLQSKILEQ